MVTKNYEIYKVSFSKLYGLSPLEHIGKSLAVKGKTGTENFNDGALHKRTTFSVSLTAAAFPDGVKSVERQSQKIFEKSFSKVKKTLHLWFLQCHQHGAKGGAKYACNVVSEEKFQNSKKVFLKEEGNLSSLALTMPSTRPA